jgi:hypothetical protein
MATRDETRDGSDKERGTDAVADRHRRGRDGATDSRVLAHDCGNGKVVLTESGNSDAWLASDAAVEIPA